MSGSAMAQAIPFATMPILTRILSPDVLGPYFIWLGIVAVLSVFLSLRLDVAIFNAQTDQELLDTIQTAIVMSVVLALTLCGIVLILTSGSPAIAEKLKLAWWSIEAITLGAVWAANMVVQSAYLYGGYFKRQAIVKIILAAAVAIAQIGAATIGGDVQRIIIFQITATAAILLFTMVDVARLYRINIIKYKFENVSRNLRMNWRFAVFSMPADFVSSATGQLPLLLLGDRFGAVVAGQYALMNRSIAAPIRLISGSVLSVFKEEASRHYRINGECKYVYLQALRRLALLGIAPFLVIYFFSELLFGLIFGNEWRQAGAMASILAPMFYLQFIASPLSYTLYLSGRNLEDLIWQLSSMLCITAILFSGVAFSEMLKMICLAYSVLYIINIYLSFRAAKVTV